MIDLFKFIASILIFAMHSKALKQYGDMSLSLELLSRWGVPFFFMASAFFLFKKNNGNISRSTLTGYMKRIALLYCLWGIFNLPSIIYSKFIEPGFSRETVISFLKQALFQSTFKGSWYLVSCIVSAAVIYCLSRHFKTEIIIVITAFIQILCIRTSVWGGWNGFVDAGPTLLYNMFFPLNPVAGCFYTALGKYAAEKEDRLSLRNMPFLICLLILSYAAFFKEVSIAEKLSFYRASDAGFFTVFLGLSVFLICICSNCRIKHGKTLRKLSVIVYCGQGNILLAGKYLGDILGISSALYIFFIRALMAAVLCCIVLWLQKHSKAKWLQYLT